jgi:SAM-dependent methyltransferase
VRHIKQYRSTVSVVGVEPVGELREVGYSLGLSTTELVAGDATALPYPDSSFDVVCEFAALHHIPRPERAVAEMLRVAAKAVFISDSNNFGSGSSSARFVKQLLHRLGMWPLVDFVNTKGKGYHVSEGDGVFYSYSVFDSYRQVEASCARVHLINTLGSGRNAYRRASQVALLGIK